MPKDAARIWLRVSSVRAERLQDITIDGCRAEGIWDDYKTYSEDYHEALIQRAYPKLFSEIWDENVSKKNRKEYRWAKNPFVWVVKVERCEKPEEG